MNFTSFQEMQKAVDIVGTSPHPTNKIAATIFGLDENGEPYSISKTNYWPKIIKANIGTTEGIGNSSGTIHAETACIMAAPYTNGASITITDPPCPNCAKNMSEAGIKTIYIDHKGFDKDFAARRGEQFKYMSMRIFERAGISVYEIRRKEEKLSPIVEIPASFIPHEDNPVSVETWESHNFPSLIEKKTEDYKDRNFATCLARDHNGQVFALTARAHPAIGYSFEDNRDEILHPDGKYSFMLEPVNRLLMNAPRHGYRIIDGSFFCSQTPTAREQVNLVGARITKLIIGDKNLARDQYALAASRFLQEKHILHFNSL